MEALYNRAKLLEHGAQSPDIPMASVAAIHHLTEKHTGQLKIDLVLYSTKLDCQILSQIQLHILLCYAYTYANIPFHKYNQNTLHCHRITLSFFSGNILL